MPFNTLQRYYTDPAHFTTKAREVIQQLQGGGQVVKIDEMVIRPDVPPVELIFHRRGGIMMSMSMAGHQVYQGLSNPQVSIDKMLMYIDHAGQTGGEGSLSEMAVVRRHIFGLFQGTMDEYNAFGETGQAPDRMWVAANANQIPNMGVDFFQQVLQDIEEDEKSMEADRPRA